MLLWMSFFFAVRALNKSLTLIHQVILELIPSKHVTAMALNLNMVAFLF